MMSLLKMQQTSTPLRALLINASHPVIPSIEERDTSSLTTRGASLVQWKAGNIPQCMTSSSRSGDSSIEDPESGSTLPHTFDSHNARAQAFLSVWAVWEPGCT